MDAREVGHPAALLGAGLFSSSSASDSSQGSHVSATPPKPTAKRPAANDLEDDALSRPGTGGSKNGKCVKRKIFGDSATDLESAGGAPNSVSLFGMNGAGVRGKTGETTHAVRPKGLNRVETVRMDVRGNGGLGKDETGGLELISGMDSGVRIKVQKKDAVVLSCKPTRLADRVKSFACIQPLSLPAQMNDTNLMTCDEMFHGPTTPRIEAEYSIPHADGDVCRVESGQGGFNNESPEKTKCVNNSPSEASIRPSGPSDLCNKKSLESPEFDRTRSDSDQNKVSNSEKFINIVSSDSTTQNNEEKLKAFLKKSTVAEIKKKLRLLGVKSTGKKDNLIDALINAGMGMMINSKSKKSDALGKSNKFSDEGSHNFENNENETLTKFDSRLGGDCNNSAEGISCSDFGSWSNPAPNSKIKKNTRKKVNKEGKENIGHKSIRSSSIGRNNFVKLNLSSHGFKRKFLNKIHSKKSGQYAGSYNKRYGFKKRSSASSFSNFKRKSHRNEDDQCTDDYNATPQEYQKMDSDSFCNTLGASNPPMIWKNDGWIDSDLDRSLQAAFSENSTPGSFKITGELSNIQPNNISQFDFSSPIQDPPPKSSSMGETNTSNVHSHLDDSQPIENSLNSDGIQLTLKENNSTKQTLTGEIIEKIRQNASEENLLLLLRHAFGFDSFRDGQLQCIHRVLNEKSTMLILPTGKGKSLCYQLPALVFLGITLVVSPLVSLMIDQLKHLPKCLPGACLTSMQTHAESRDVISRLLNGMIKVLFISPEKLCSTSFQKIVSKLPFELSLVVIDEAHCVSEWSHNFRPSYFRLGKIIRADLKPKCTIALSATATKSTQSSILNILSMPSDSVIRHTKIPENLLLSVSRTQNSLNSLLILLNKPPFKDSKSTIIYCTFQNDADYLANKISSIGFTVKSYHGGKSSKQREMIQQQFCNNKIKVIVATVAFGMGLDKSDIRAVIHYNVPRSIEQYVQEIGRAGRDGLPSHCHLFLNDNDYVRLQSLSHSESADESSIHKFLALIFHQNEATRFEDKGQNSNLVNNREFIPRWNHLLINNLARKLDMKEEVMSTIIAYLDRGNDPYLNLSSEIWSTCTLTFLKKAAEELAKTNILIAAILKRYDMKDGYLTFKITDVANFLKWDLITIQRELQQLHSGGDITCRFSDSAFSFLIRRTPSSFLNLVAEVVKHMSDMEESKISKLNAMYCLASEMEKNFPCGPSLPSVASLEINKENGIENVHYVNGSLPSNSSMERKIEEDSKAIEDAIPRIHSETVIGNDLNSTECNNAIPILERQRLIWESKIEDYFNSEHTTALDDKLSQILKPSSPFLLADIRVFLHAHKDTPFTGRSVAKIFHGISSPAFPHSDWSKNHFWQRYMDVDFDCIRKLAQQEIVTSRRQ